MSQVSEQQHPSCNLSTVQFNAVGQCLLVLVLTVSLLLLYARAIPIDSADDVFFLRADNGTYDLALANYVNGRIFPAVVFHLLSTFGIEIPFVFSDLRFAAFIALAAFAVLFISQLELPLSWLETLALAGVIAAFPYVFNLLANKNNAVNAFIAYATVGAAIYCHRRSTRWTGVVTAAFFLIICLGSYQTTLYYFIIFVCGYLVFHGTDRRDVYTRIAAGVAACLLAIFVYVVLYRSVQEWALLEMAKSANPGLAVYYGSPRSALNSLNGFMTSAIFYVLSIGRVLLAPEPILPLAIKLVALGTFWGGYRYWRGKANRETPATTTGRFIDRKRRLLILVLILAAGSPIHLAIADNWIAPRVLAHAGAIWAILLLTSLVFTPPNWRGRISLGIVIVLLGFAFSTLKTTLETSRLEKRDLELARKIIASLTQNPHFQPEKPIAVVGLLDGKTSYMANTWSYFNLNTSKFGNAWSMRAFLEVVAGRNFPAPGPDFADVAEKLCGTERNVPEHFRIVIADDGTAVCLQ